MTEDKFMWHYMEKKDLGSTKAKTACGISTWNAGLATCNLNGVKCKNCLRVIESKRKKMVKELYDLANRIGDIIRKFK